MIGLIQNHIIYEYDLRSLILAFCRGEKVELTDSVSSTYTYVLKVLYEDKQTTISLYQENHLLEDKTLEGDYLDKKVFKNKLKLGVYALFAHGLNQTLPWGTLTGIRPTKLALKEFDKEKEIASIKDTFVRRYAMSRQKAELCVDVAKKELEILSQFPYEDKYSLYIGIPFCPTTCLYCSFASYPIGEWKELVRPYLDALLQEARFVADQYQNKTLQTIYVGGGTPTSLDQASLDYLLTKIDKLFPLAKVEEVTVEAGRPDSITKEKLGLLRDFGISRISINPQTMNAHTLSVIGRNHTPDDVRQVYSWAREEGFHNINMDTICGLPGETMKELCYTFDEIKKMNPDSLTVHSLAIKRTSKLKDMQDQYTFGATEEMLDYSYQVASSMGMLPYYMYRQKNIPGNLENVGYAYTGKECLYNILIMEELHDIIAIGAGTSSKIVSPSRHNIKRIENVKNIHQYIARIDEMIQRKSACICNEE